MAIIISGDNTFIADVVNIITKLFCSYSLAKIRFFAKRIKNSNTWNFSIIYCNEFIYETRIDYCA